MKKNHIKGSDFETMKKIQEVVTAALNHIQSDSWLCVDTSKQRKNSCKGAWLSHFEEHCSSE